MLRYLTVATSLAAVAVGTPIDSQRIVQRATDDISSCGGRWMPRADVNIAQGTDRRTGFDSAVDRFCTAVHGKTVPAGGYLSMVTEVFLNGGKNPNEYGVVGFLHCEVHNKLKSDHLIDANNCKQYLKALSVPGGKCSGSTNADTKGGTWQVGNNGVSYHAIGEDVPSQQDALDKLWTDGALKVQSVSKGRSAALNPWPFSTIRNIRPAACHSHNDYDRNIPLWAALSAGCSAVEADVWLVNNEALLGHLLPEDRTLDAQYVAPIKAIIDYNNCNKAGGSIGVYPAKPDETLVLMIDFKSTDTKMLDVVVKALQPLRDAGYLSYYDDAAKEFIRRQVTVVASGAADYGRIRTRDGVPHADVFYDAQINAWNSTYSRANSYYASTSFKEAVGNPSNVKSFSEAQKQKVREQVSRAHGSGLFVRYWDLPGEWIWEALADLGVDKLNADDMYNTARLRRL